MFVETRGQVLHEIRQQDKISLALLFCDKIVFWTLFIEQNIRWGNLIYLSKTGWLIFYKMVIDLRKSKPQRWGEAGLLVDVRLKKSNYKGKIKGWIMRSFSSLILKKVPTTFWCFLKNRFPLYDSTVTKCNYSKNLYALDVGQSEVYKSFWCAFTLLVLLSSVKVSTLNMWN